MPGLLWDVYCRVVDNFGDAGVCWRLAADLAARGERVRLVIDDATPLAFMAPGGAVGVQVLSWPGPAEPGDVVIETFGCDLPSETVAAMAKRRPVWINLEYMSAEAFVERSHGLPSPQPNGLTKWFFFPGFTPRTGGLLRERGLMARRAAFDRHAWLATQGLALHPGERLVSLFCYEAPALPALLRDLALQPTLLLLTPGHAQRQVKSPQPGLRLHALPWLTQAGYDELLWACDLNFVRGEDSLARALWAGQPCVWQIYPQRDGAHAAKLQAMLHTLNAAPEVAAVWRAWNGLQAGPWPGLPAFAPWQLQAEAARQKLLARPGLTTQLCAFVASQAMSG